MKEKKNVYYMSAQMFYSIAMYRIPEKKQLRNLMAIPRNFYTSHKQDVLDQIKHGLVGIVDVVTDLV